MSETFARYLGAAIVVVLIAFWSGWFWSVLLMACLVLYTYGSLEDGGNRARRQKRNSAHRRR